MADSGIPDKVSQGIRLAIFWIGLPFIGLLLGGEDIRDGRYLEAWPWFACAVASVVIAVYWSAVARLFAGAATSSWGWLSHQPHATLAGSLYVGSMQIGIDKLEKDHWVELLIIGFNGSPRRLRVTEISGHAIFSRESSVPSGPLPTPTFMPKFPRELAANKEFYIALQQIVPASIAEDFLTTLSQGVRIFFALGALNVEVGTLSKRRETALIPLWDGISAVRSSGQLLCGRVQSASARG